MLSRFHSIPRFALPYTPLDFAAALAAIVTGAPPAEEFQLIRNQAKFWTSSGRQALRLILEAMDLPPGSGVAVPLFTDPSVIGAIAGSGHKPVFIDVSETTLTMDPESLWAARRKYSAVVIVHLFGHVADMASLLPLAADAPVIEDTAHSPLSFLDGRMTGDFGAASFYSFASTKYWPAGGGGLVALKDARLARGIAPRVAALTPVPRGLEIRNALTQLAKSAVFSRPLYGILGRPLRRRVERYAFLEPQLNSSAIQRGHAAVACRQAARFALRVERQRENSLQLLSHLSDTEDLVLPWERPSARYNYHIFPVLLRDSDERARVAETMWSKFIDTSLIYHDVVQKCQPFGYTGGCPVSESVATRLLTLPNHSCLSAADVERVADVFRSCLKTARDKRRGAAGRTFQAAPLRQATSE